MRSPCTDHRAAALLASARALEGAVEEGALLACARVVVMRAAVCLVAEAAGALGAVGRSGGVVAREGLAGRSGLGGGVSVQGCAVGEWAVAGSVGVDLLGRVEEGWPKGVEVDGLGIEAVVAWLRGALWPEGAPERGHGSDGRGSPGGAGRLGFEGRGGGERRSSGAAEGALDRLGDVYQGMLGLELRRCASGALEVVEGGGRHRSGVHYTPSGVARRIVARALGPRLVAGSGEPEPPGVILGLRVCDPSMGCGAFLIEACRALSAGLEASWAFHGENVEGDQGLEARRRVVGRCLYGVDLDPVSAAVARAALEIMAGSLGGGACGGRLRQGDALRLGEGQSAGDPGGWRGRFPEVFGRPRGEGGSRGSRGDEGERGGFDVVLGNPPYVSGARRPAVSGRFALRRGAWDLWWIFVELGASISSSRGSSYGYLLPDALLARESTRAVRRLMMGEADRLWVRHEGAVFEASVSAVSCCGLRARGERGAREVIFERVEAGGRVVGSRHEVSDLDVASARWPPVGGGGAGRLLGELVRIGRGEEVGKSSLRQASAARAGDRVAVAGEGVARAYGAPRATRAIEVLRKGERVHGGPKVVVVKTGRRLRAAIDREGLAILQSVYSVHLRADAPGWLTIEVLCGLLNAGAVDRRFVGPITSGKKIFPQITQRMIREIRVPEIGAVESARIVGWVRALEAGPDAGAEAALEAAFDGLYEGEGL